MPLGEVIRRQCEAWGMPELPLERALFGSGDPEVIARAVDSWCRAHLGSAIDAYEFFDSSSGSVHGVRLADGRRVVVKAHRSAVDSAYMSAVQDLQRALADSGYPAPRPLVPAVPLGTGFASAETMLVAPKVSAFEPAVRDALAVGLADFVARAAPHRDRIAAHRAPMEVPHGALYPEPHSPRFDFDATAAGAEWIDDLARRARARMRVESERVLMHGDWRIDNVRVADGRVVAVYDWDSLHVLPEAVGLAPAALTYTVDWGQTGRLFPYPSEIAAFIATYEAARGAAVDHDLLAAAMVATLTYGARCEHCVPGLVRPDDSQTALLRNLGESLLRHGLDPLHQ
jgi:Ser/Thr protein kinase RdoA (MazF antagonist)